MSDQRYGPRRTNSRQGPKREEVKRATKHSSADLDYAPEGHVLTVCEHRHHTRTKEGMSSKPARKRRKKGTEGDSDRKNRFMNESLSAKPGMMRAICLIVLLAFCERVVQRRQGNRSRMPMQRSTSQRHGRKLGSGERAIWSMLTDLDRRDQVQHERDDRQNDASHEAEEDHHVLACKSRDQ